MPFLDIFPKQKIEKEKIEKQFQLTKPKIIADYREKNSLIIAELISLGCEVEFKNLEVADYLIKNVAIERKTVSDFLSSMLNKRLIVQLQSLQQFENKLLIIEGIEEQELYNDNYENKEKSQGINPNAIRGFLLSISLKHKIPIIFTKNYEDSARYLYVLAKKPEQEQETGLNAKRKARDKKEQLQYILESFPGIGPKTAKKLLKEFKTIKKILNQDMEKLNSIIGKKADIFKLLDEKY